MASTTVRSERELQNCTFVKTVLMISVLLYHSVLFWGGKWFTADPVVPCAPLAWLAKWLNSFHIYGFTFISGYLFYYLKQEKGKYQQYGPFLKGKVRRLLIPYGFVAAVWVLPVSILWKGFDLSAVLRDFVLGVSPNQLWFLLMLFVVFALVWPLSGLMAKRNLLTVVLCLAFYGLGTVGSAVLPNVFQVWTACKYTVFFVAGFKLRQYGSWLVMRIPGIVWLAADLLLFVLWQWLTRGQSLPVNLLTMGLGVLVNLVGALMFFVILQKIASKTNHRSNRVMGVLAKYAMPVYLFHQQIIYLSIFLLNGVVHPYWNAAANFLAGFSISLLLSFVLMKFRPTRYLIGEK